VRPDRTEGALLAGRFRLEGALGRGGMGAVYAAFDVDFGHRVAIKVLGREAAGDPDAMARFAREAVIAGRLSSPHVVAVHGAGRSADGDPFIVMELLEGRDLARVIAARQTLAVVDAVRLVLEAAIGTAAAHAAGLVHRDLKPANLFLARDAGGREVVKVLDFGLSKVTGPVDQALTQSATAFGTPQYMSPEQVMSAKHVDARCDQHALAMILFELLVKRPPFLAPTAAALAAVIVTQPAPSVRALRADVPRGLDEVIARALAKKPADRFADLGAFARALARFGGPGALALADDVARTLDARADAARTARPGPASDELETLPDLSTMPGFATGPAGARSSASFWIAATALVVGALGATALALGNRATVSAARSPEPSFTVTPIAAPTLEATAVTVGAAASSPPPIASSSASAGSAKAATLAPPPPMKTTRRPARPATTTAPPAPDPQDPAEVFGHAH
jgi:serine/threonine-protein kinase